VVTNSAPRLPATLMPASFGEGLRNVSARLHAAYDGDAWICVGPDPVGGTRAELNVPIAVKNAGNVEERTN
jgi:hypothetical protein